MTLYDVDILLCMKKKKKETQPCLLFNLNELQSTLHWPISYVVYYNPLYPKFWHLISFYICSSFQTSCIEFHCSPLICKCNC